jgi:cytochrome c1
MKIAKRISLVRGVERMMEPSPGSHLETRMRYNRDKDYQLSVEDELFKYGYRNNLKNFKAMVLGVIGVSIGVFIDGL